MLLLKFRFQEVVKYSLSYEFSDLEFHPGYVINTALLAVILFTYQKGLVFSGNKLSFKEPMTAIYKQLDKETNGSRS